MNGITKSAGIVFFREDRVLLVYHKEKAKHQTGVYGIPAGRLEPGENELDAAIRETFNETQIKVKSNDLLSLPDVYQAEIKRKRENPRIFSLKVFVCASFEDCPKETDETIPEWVKISELNKLNLLPNVKSLIFGAMELKEISKEDLLKSEDFSPLGACWNITSNCNYSCVFCYAKKDSKNKLDLEKQKNIISRLRSAGILYITFSGGEPLLVKHLTKLIKYAKDLGMYTDLSTNGANMTESILEDIEKSLDKLSIPLDGSNNEVIYKIRGIKNHMQVFYKVLTFIKNKNIQLNINTLVCKFNESDLFNLFEILKSVNKINRWKLIRYYPLGQGLKEFILSKERFNEIISKIIKQTSPFQIVAKMKTEDDQRSFILVDPDGKIYLTAKNKHIILGDIFKEDLRNILKKNCVFNKKGHVEKYSRYATKVSC